MAGDISVRLTFYDNPQRSPVILGVKGDSTAAQLYSKVTAEVNVNSKFQLFYKDDLIKQCDTALSQIFQGSEADVLLVVTMDGTGGRNLISPCANCPNYLPGDDHGLICGTCNDLTDDLIIDDIVTIRSDAWSVLLRAFNIRIDVRQQIEENSEDPGVRCIDVMHRIYHSNTKLTWDDVKDKMKSYDPKLAKVISECDFSHLN